MRQFVGIRPLLVLAVVAAWRCASELIWRRRELAVAGALEPRIEARRAARIHHALDLRGLLGVPVHQLGRTHASVSVGSVLGGDIDDVGLLEGAMRRAARERMSVSSTGVNRTPLITPLRDATRHDWGSMIVTERVDRPRPRLALLADAWPVLLLLAGAAITFAPLVRPLADVAPWLALAGTCLVIAGLLGRGRRSDATGSGPTPRR